LLKRSLIFVFIFIFSCFMPATAFAAQTPFTVSVTLENRLSMIRRGSFEIKGTLTLSKPADSIIVSIYDERKASEVYNRVFTPTDKALSYPLSSVIRSSAFSKLTAGEKTLRVIVTCEDECITALEQRFTMLGKVASYAEITRKCTFETRQDPYCLWNGSYYRKYSWKPSEKENTLTVRFPANTAVSTVQLEWFLPPTDFSFESLSADGTIISSISYKGDYNLYNDSFDIDENTCAVRITVNDYESAICALHVFEKSGPNVDVQSWSPMPEKLDILHISTHQDDELLFFGGSIAYHCAAGYETGVLYMADCGRTRYAEALSGLWISGLTYHPEFLGLVDFKPETLKQALKAWGGADNVTALLTEAIRKYKPDVIVTHGSDGEYGHKQHIVTSNAVVDAVANAMNPEYHPESYDKYGAWTVKKLYLHQTFGDNVIQMNWNTPLDAFDGRTSLEMSEIAYNRHVSQIESLPYSYGAKYAPDVFNLAYSAVGPDILGGDFFENIPE